MCVGKVCGCLMGCVCCARVGGPRRATPPGGGVYSHRMVHQPSLAEYRLYNASSDHHSLHPTQSCCPARHHPPPIWYIGFYLLCVVYVYVHRPPPSSIYYVWSMFYVYPLPPPIHPPRPSEEWGDHTRDQTNRHSDTASKLFKFPDWRGTWA